MKLLLLLMLASCEPPVHGFVPHPFVTSKITTQVETFMYSPKNTGKEEDKKYCIPLDELRLEDLPKVGGKTASLGEMIQQLAPLGVSVPGGFGVTSSVYDAVLDRFELRERLQDLLKDVDGTYNMQCCGHSFHAVILICHMRVRIFTGSDLDALAYRGRQARHMIIQAGLPEDTRKAIENSYKAMALNGEDVSVAVRSSATAEDLPTASFAGQQASFLNVIGASQVANAALECLASVYTDRAITYRLSNNFAHAAVKGAVAVQHMVRSDLASSGVAFTLDPDTGFRDVVVITGSYGLGESVVGGKVDPDEVQVFKTVLGEADDPIIRRRIGRKQTRIVYTHGVSHERTKTIRTTKVDQIKPSFTDEDSKVLAKWCVDIENHYTQLHGHPTPMDIEWAKDGLTDKLYIVQARPETVRAQVGQGVLTQTIVTDTGPLVLEGTACGSDAAVGAVRVIRDLKDIATMKKGDILCSDLTDPDCE